MSTQAQIAANRSNAQHSTGPKTPEGKAVSARNNLRFGLTGNSFTVMAWEKQEEFDALLADLRAEHRPGTRTEHLLVEKMAQSFWLGQRAELLQTLCFHREVPACAQGLEKDLALYMRYQTTHDRAFHKALGELLKLRAEKRKAEIGFESQERKRNEEGRRQAEETRREASENRKQELHQLAVSLAEAKLTHQEVLTSAARPPVMQAATAQKDKLAAQQAA